MGVPEEWIEGWGGLTFTETFIGGGSDFIGRPIDWKPIYGDPGSEG